MKKHLIVLATLSGLALAGCTTTQGALVGGAAGAAIGGAATRSVGGALVGAGIGALAGAILVESSKGWCTYRYKGRLYRERCR